MASHIKKLLKQLPFHGKTIKSRIKMLNYYLSYHFLKNLKKNKIRQLTTKTLLQEQPFYKQPRKNHVLKN